MDFQLEVAKGTVRKSCIFPEISQFEKETFPRFERSCESHRDRSENKKKPVSTQCPGLQFDCTALIMYTHDLYANSRAMCMLRRTTREVNFSPPWYYYTHTITAFKVHELSVSCAAENDNNTVQLKVYHALDVRRRDCAYNYPTERFMHVYGMKSIRPRGGASLYNG